MDRANLQKEVNSLTSEIDRISKSANFNGIKLLDGSLSGMQVEKSTSSSSGASGVGGKSTVQQFAILENFNANDVITIDGKDYTFGNGSNGTVTLGTNVEDTAANLAKAINDNADSNVKAKFEDNKLKLYGDGNYAFSAPKVRGGATTGTDLTGAAVSIVGATAGGRADIDFSGAKDSSNFKNGETMEIGGKKFTFVTKDDGNTENAVKLGKNLDETLQNLTDKLNNSEVKLADSASKAIDGTWGYNSDNNTITFLANDAMTTVSTTNINYTKPGNTDAGGKIAMAGETIGEGAATAKVTFTSSAASNGIDDAFAKGTEVEIGGKTYKLDQLTLSDGKAPSNFKEQMMALKQAVNKDYDAGNIDVHFVDGGAGFTEGTSGNDTYELVLATRQTGVEATSIGDVKLSTFASDVDSTVSVTYDASTSSLAGEAAVKGEAAKLDFELFKGGMDSFSFAVSNEMTINGLTIKFDSTVTVGGSTITGKAVTIGTKDGDAASQMQKIVEMLNTNASSVTLDGATATVGGEWAFSSANGTLSWTANDRAKVAGFDASSTAVTTNGFKGAASTVTGSASLGATESKEKVAHLSFTVTAGGTSSNFKAGEKATIAGKDIQFINAGDEVDAGAIGVLVGTDIDTTMKNLADALNRENAGLSGFGVGNSYTNGKGDVVAVKGSWSYDPTDTAGGDAGTLTWTEDENTAGTLDLNEVLSGSVLDATKNAVTDHKGAKLDTVDNEDLVTEEKGGSAGYTLKGLDDDMGTGGGAGVNGINGGSTKITFKDTMKAGDTFQVGDTKYQIGKAGDAVGEGYTLLEVADGENGTYSGAQVAAALANAYGEGAIADGKQVIIGADENGKLVDAKAINAGGLVLQVGETSDDYQKVTVAVNSMSAEALGIGDINIGGPQEEAAAAIDKIKAAINTVSSTRGDLGAIQNRLEHTINNLGVTTENMTAAESRIRDTDMAKEMMEFTKNNILVQASQAMLAQANQQPQGVLQLLQ